MRAWLGGLLWLSGGAAAFGQPPPGQSARLFGVHDLSAESIAYLQGATTSCDKGWITHLLYLEGGSQEVTPPPGIQLIVRLDWNGAASAPADVATRGPYADRFVETVARSPSVHVWILGNEPNFTIAGPFPPLTSFIEPYIEPFVDNYARVRDRLHAVAGHERDLLLLPAPSPWSPCFLEGFARIIRGIDARGVTIDGFAIHPGTRHPTDSQRAERVDSDARVGGNCEVGYTDSYDQYRVFEDFIQVVDDLGHTSKPIFLTESAHNTDAPSVVNHVDEDRGFFAAMYRRVDAYNATHGGRIRALTPYRWERFGDGTGRDHSLRDKPALQRDHRAGAGYTWTEPACGGPSGCRLDGECGDRELCLDGRCAPATDCPCAAGEVCRADANVCVPASRGVASITFAPASPPPGSTVRIDVFATTGYTNVDLLWEGPLGTPSRPSRTFVAVDPGFHWLYDAQVPAAGTYRATFTADPGATVYGVAYLDVPGAPSPDAGAASGTDGGTDAGADGGGVGRDASIGGRDADGPDATRPSSGVSGGCSCRTTGQQPPLALALLLLLGLPRLSRRSSGCVRLPSPDTGPRRRRRGDRERSRSACPRETSRSPR